MAPKPCIIIGRLTGSGVWRPSVFVSQASDFSHLHEMPNLLKPPVIDPKRQIHLSLKGRPGERSLGEATPGRTFKLKMEAPRPCLSFSLNLTPQNGRPPEAQAILLSGQLPAAGREEACLEGGEAGLPLLRRALRGKKTEVAGEGGRRGAFAVRACADLHGVPRGSEGRRAAQVRTAATPPPTGRAGLPRWASASLSHPASPRPFPGWVFGEAFLKQGGEGRPPPTQGDN